MSSATNFAWRSRVNLVALLFFFFVVVFLLFFFCFFLYKCLEHLLYLWLIWSIMKNVNILCNIGDMDILLDKTLYMNAVKCKKNCITLNAIKSIN